MGDERRFHVKSIKPFAIALLWLGAGCRQTETPPSAPAPKMESTRMPENKLDLPPGTKLPDGFSKLSPDMQREWLRAVWRRPLEKAQAKADMVELVRPAPASFRSDGKEKSLKLTLIPLKTRLRAGESLWYKLEMQNVGASSISWIETNSFFKSGTPLGSESFRIHLTLPSGDRVEGMAYPFLIGHCPGNPGPKKILETSGVSEEDFKDMFTKATAKSAIKDELNLILAPGESLVTRPWRYVDPCFPKEPTEAERAALAKGFREWPWDKGRATFGKYSVRFELHHPPPKWPDEETLAAVERKHGMSRASQLTAFEVQNRFALGIVWSNEIQIELTP